MVEKLNIENFRRYGSKNYSSEVLDDSEVTFLWEVGVKPFIYLSIFYIYTALPNRRSKASNFLVFHTLRATSLRQYAFLLLILSVIP